MEYAGNSPAGGQDRCTALETFDTRKIDVNSTLDDRCRPRQYGTRHNPSTYYVGLEPPALVARYAAQNGVRT
ncbi:MAG: hypothetical protein ACJ70Q_05390 [Nitrososphaera sp.]